MAIRLPLITEGVTLTELPGEVAVYFEIGNCTKGCPGCHSEHLRTRIHRDLFTDLSELLDYAEKEKARGATAIILMGGTTNGITPQQLGEVIKALAKVLPVGLYSGAAHESTIHLYLMQLHALRWIKTGDYQEAHGGLSQRGTNQIFMERQGIFWLPRTHVFQ